MEVVLIRTMMILNQSQLNSAIIQRANVEITKTPLVRPLSRSWPIIVGWLMKITGG